MLSSNWSENDESYFNQKETQWRVYRRHLISRCLGHAISLLQAETAIYIYIYTQAFCSLHYIRVTVHSIVYYTVPLTMNGHNRVIFSSLDRHHWIGKKGLGEGKLVRIVLEYLVIYTPLQRINRKAVGWCRLRLIRVIIHLRGSNNFRWWLTERGTNVTGAIMWAAAQITSLNNLVQ